MDTMDVDVQDGHDRGKLAITLACELGRLSVRSGFGIESPPNVALERTDGRTGRRTQESRNGPLYVGRQALPRFNSRSSRDVAICSVIIYIGPRNTAR